MTRDDYEMLKDLTTEFEICYEKLFDLIDTKFSETHESVRNLIDKLNELYDIYEHIIHYGFTLIPDELSLEPCPCCGGNAQLIRLEHKDGFANTYYIECQDCFIRTYESADKELVFDTWNYRKQKEEKMQEIKNKRRIMNYAL